MSGYCKQRIRIRQGRRATTCSSAVFAWATPDGNLLRTTCRENDCRRRCRRSLVSRLLNASTYQATLCRYRLWSACERPFSDTSLFHKNDWKGVGTRQIVELRIENLWGVVSCLGVFFEQLSWQSGCSGRRHSTAIIQHETVEKSNWRRRQATAGSAHRVFTKRASVSSIVPADTRDGSKLDEMPDR